MKFTENDCLLNAYRSEKYSPYAYLMKFLGQENNLFLKLEKLKQFCVWKIFFKEHFFVCELCACSSCGDQKKTNSKKNLQIT